MKKLVITHANCIDGCCSRAVLEDKLGKNAHYIEVEHSDIDKKKFPQKFERFFNEIKDFSNTEIYMADICLNEEMIDYFLSKNNKVIILDHHATAIPLIEKIQEKIINGEHLNIEIFFSKNNSKSGAMITWEYANPGIEPPKLIKYVSDGDLWTFNYAPETHYFYSGILANNVQPKEVDKSYWLNLLNDEQEVNKIVKKGEPIYEPYIKEVKSFIPFAVEITLNGHKGYMVNASMKYKSELGNFLAQKNNTFGLVWEEKEDMIACSLRSIKPFSVKEIAEKFGGGGHSQASAFRLRNKEELEEILKNEMKKNKIKI
jgi:nanoRNase/pAp phosphatase (c-di-AMP/oligoRNAs hydrolase)